MNFLIVEDEKSSRDGILQLLSEHFSQITIDTAQDGEEGLSLALDVLPDLIITDIRMPRRDGISMIEQLRAKGISSHIILLTGYAEFEYAQKAINLGVSNYILKPVNTVELLEQVQSIVSSIEREKQKSSMQSGTASKLYLVSDDDQPLIYDFLRAQEYTDYFIAALYLGNSEKLPTAVKQALYASKDTYVVTLFEQHYCGIILGFRRHMISYTKISWLSSQLTPYKNIVCIYKLALKSQISDWLKEFQILIHSISWSITYQSSFFSYEPYMNNEIELQTKEFEGELEQYKKELQKQYFKENYDQCYALIKRQISRMQSQNTPPQKIVSAVVSSIMKVSSSSLYYATISSINKALTLNELYQCLDRYFGASKPKGEQYSRIVQQSILYIKENYNRSVSLTSVAEKLRITPQYLSKLFAQETSMTFIDYLSNYRLERAQALLTESNLQINEISKRIGYEDPKYFCTLFKKKIGITPNQYRKVHST